MKLHQKLRAFNENKYSQPFESSRLSRLRIKKILHLVGSGHRVLDVGCYDGTISLNLEKQGNTVVGIDAAESAVKLARRKGLTAVVCNLDEDQLPRGLGRFDVVVAGEVIEHTFDPDTFVQKLYTSLKPGGFLVLTTPNLAGIGSRLSLLLGKTPWMIENSLQGNVSGHLRYFTAGELSQLLARHGFKISVLTSDSVGLGPILTLPFMENIVPSLGRILIIKAIRA